MISLLWFSDSIVYTTARCKTTPLLRQLLRVRLRKTSADI